MKFEKERINNDFSRIKVKGGWVLHEFDMRGNTMCFIPDKNHSWEIDK